MANINISKDVIVCTKNDLLKMLRLAYRDAQNKNEFIGLSYINEVLENGKV